jgi:hypothetical protein
MLCRVAVPVTIRLPAASSLKQHSFFTSRLRQANGTVRLYLQMGYFETLAEAQKCAQSMRTTYPEAIAMRATPEVLRQAGSGIPTLPAAAKSRLTGNQVMSVLEPPPATPGAGEVCFAVQLRWSVEPIDPASIPALAIFRAYTLYVMQGQREGRTWYCLRLGFFSEALSAKQVAQYLRSQFTGVAVVPVRERERARAVENAVSPAATSIEEQQRGHA